MGPEPESKKGKAKKMEKSTLFENLLNEPMETRSAAIDSFAARARFNAEALSSLLTCYHSARARNADEMILALGSGSYAFDAACILDAAGVRSVLLVEECPAVLSTLHSFLFAGWQVSPINRWQSAVSYIPALRLSRA